MGGKRLLIRTVSHYSVFCTFYCGQLTVRSQTELQSLFILCAYLSALTSCHSFAFLVCNFEFWRSVLTCNVLLFISSLCLLSHPFHSSPAFHQLINPPRSFKSLSSPLFLSVHLFCLALVFPCLPVPSSRHVFLVFGFWFLVLFLVCFCFLGVTCFVICLCFTFLYFKFELAF